MVSNVFYSQCPLDSFPHLTARFLDRFCQPCEVAQLVHCKIFDLPWQTR